RFAAPGVADWALADEEVVLGEGDPATPLAHCVEINALTFDTVDGAQLTAHWTWASSLLTEQAVRDLAEAWFRGLQALVGHACRPGAGGRSPSDLPLVALTQAEIGRLERRYPQIEDVLPLSPLQEGLLFHALYDARAPDVYTVQVELDLAGALDASVLRAAVQALMARHASLRAGFPHENLARPVQVIVPTVEPSWRTIDLSMLEDAERDQRLAGILAADRAERFDPASPPLMRFMLIHLATDRHRLVLTNHHLLTDGWSMPV